MLIIAGIILLVEWIFDQQHLEETGQPAPIHVLSGEAGMWYGERLEQHMITRPGDHGRK